MSSLAERAAIQMISLTICRGSTRDLGVIINLKAIAESEYLRWVDSSRLYQISRCSGHLWGHSVLTLESVFEMTLALESRVCQIQGCR